jgi:hypothetical protein
MKPLLLSVDFDDTIARSNYPEILGEVPGAVAGLKELHKYGQRIQIWTCRHGEALEQARQWLDEQGVPYERINENCPALIEKWGETRKMSADIYIDDKMLGGLPPWPRIVEQVASTAHYLEQKELRAKFNRLPRIIGLSGKRGSGKDTVAKFMHNLTPWAFFEDRLFAGKLKEFAKQLTGESDVFSQAGKTKFLPDWNMTVGELLQKLGTDAVRNGLHENAWVLACFAGMSADKHYIITDCRFPNEAEAIKARGGVVWRIEGDPLGQQGDGTRNDAHPSETALDDYQGFDCVIRNEGTLDELRATVGLHLQRLCEQHE